MDVNAARLRARPRAGDRAEALLSRICTPVAKYWACKRAPQFVVEALECHGGNGFIADHLMERLYREAPLNGIWEGTGNVICLDVLRSMQREPDTVAAFLDEIRAARGADARLDAFTDEVEHRLANLNDFEPVARRVVEMMAFALQGKLARASLHTRGCRRILRDAPRWRLGPSFRYDAKGFGHAGHRGSSPHRVRLRQARRRSALAPRSQRYRRSRLLGISDRPHAGRFRRP